MLRIYASLIKCFWGIVLAVGVSYTIYFVFSGVALMISRTG